MQNVTINGAKTTRDYERKVRLVNGTLVIHYDSYNRPIGTYIVTSYRTSNSMKEGTANYCQLINLDDGTIFCEEPVSRYTTELRLLRHLCRCKETTGYRDYNDSKIAGSYTREYSNSAYGSECSSGSYKIDLILEDKD